MKSLEEFYNVFEGRPKGSTNKPKENVVPSPDQVVQNGKVVPVEQVKLDQQEGKKPTVAGKRGLWAVDEPSDDRVVDLSDKTVLSRNKKKLARKFRHAEPFFIMGRAGWGKTSLVKDMASTFKRHVITVYLDKACKEDLGGLPVPTKEAGVAVQVMAIPAWAAFILDHSNDPEATGDPYQFLLFFDEMNQADPDIMNALMPIVLETTVCGIKFDNFFVGAAGNFESENSAVQELSKPLESRFKPIIIWESNTEEAWKDSFKWQHSKFDGKLGKDLVDAFEKEAMKFQAPRELTDKIFKYIISGMGEGADVDDEEEYEERIEDLLEPQYQGGKERKMVQKLASMCYAVQKNGGPVDFSQQKKGRNAVKLPADIQKFVVDALNNGKTHPEGLPEAGYVSMENVCDCFDYNDLGINREIAEQTIQDLIDAGTCTPKYKTNAEAEKATGLKPLHEL